MDIVGGFIDLLIMDIGSYTFTLPGLDISDYLAGVARQCGVQALVWARAHHPVVSTQYRGKHRWAQSLDLMFHSNHLTIVSANMSVSHRMVENGKHHCVKLSDPRFAQ